MTQLQPPVRRGARLGRAPRWALALAVLLALVGCARYNTYYNASQAFDRADHERQQRLKRGEDVQQASGTEKKEYELAILKCQKLMDEYPGHGLTDDALFLMAKSYHRLGSHRMSINKFELLFANFPGSGHREEALHLQALNYMYIGDVARSNELLETLARNHPKSRYAAESLRVRGENSFRLEDWAAAREHLERFLTDHPADQRSDDAAYMLGQALWKLEEYGEAATRLQALAERADSHERAFRARLLLGRCLVRLDRHDEAEALASRLKTGAEAYGADGEVALLLAENLRSRGRDGEAAALLENMPTEWRAREVGPRAGEMLALIYLDRLDFEQARKQLQDAVKGGKALDDLPRIRSLVTVVQDYLGAEQVVKGAEPARAAPYRLLMAANLLFGLDRPRLALGRYLEVAGEPAADPDDRARALYGAAWVCRQRLQLPDSASVFEQRLQADHPDSPQAFQVRTGGRGDLLAHLLEQRRLLAATGQLEEQDGPPRPGPAPDDPFPVLETAGEPAPDPAGASAAADTLTAFEPLPPLPSPAAADSSLAPPDPAEGDQGGSGGEEEW